MTDESLRDLVVLALLVSHGYVVFIKIVTLGLMFSNERKTGLDRAIINTQGALVAQFGLWLSVVWLPQRYPELIREWYIAWLVVSAWLIHSVTWLTVELWKERIRPMWHGWRFRWRGRTVPGAGRLLRRSRADVALERTATATERTADATERIADRET